ncbi:unnamed protein product [Protopolystoma xenopodis]|uniref:B30.2/SPRY domain-containing protein n=1 Tax=Protopolystoma xenopodis TaxID=117903 RepID=A0A3S5FBK6_9PLAT|nr:unnamed protein product [Protopolystoma xenopodis]
MDFESLQHRLSLETEGVFGPGRFYFEATPLEAIGLCRVGWSTEEANLLLGTDAFGFGYGADTEGFGISGQQGKRMHNDEIENYGEAFFKSDVIGCLLDTIEGTVKWTRNGVEFGIGYTLPPQMLQNSCFFPAASLLNSTVEFNFGALAFKHFPGSRRLQTHQILFRLGLGCLFFPPVLPSLYFAPPGIYAVALTHSILFAWLPARTAYEEIRLSLHISVLGSACWLLTPLLGVPGALKQESPSGPIRSDPSINLCICSSI